MTRVTPNSLSDVEIDTAKCLDYNPNRLCCTGEINMPALVHALVHQLSVDGNLLYFYGEGLSQIVLKKQCPRYFQFASSCSVAQIIDLLDLSLSQLNRDYLYKTKTSTLVLSNSQGKWGLLDSEFLKETQAPFYIEITCNQSYSSVFQRLAYWSIDKPICDFKQTVNTDDLYQDEQNQRLSFDLEKHSSYLNHSVFWMSLIRYSYQFGWEWQWMKEHFDKVAVKKHFNKQFMSFRRLFRKEWLKLFDYPKPSVLLEEMRTLGLLDIILPELMEGYEVEQNEFHAYDVYYHGLYSCDMAEEPLIRMAALMHDIGKPKAKKRVLGEGTHREDRNVFYDHENIGARMTFSVLKRFGLHPNTVHQVTKLVRLHMFHYTREWRNNAVRRFMAKAGNDMDNLFKLRVADRLGSGKKTRESKALNNLMQRILEIQAEDRKMVVKDLNVDGTLLMNELHLNPGPELGNILKHLLHLVVHEGVQNERAILLEKAKCYYHNK